MPVQPIPDGFHSVTPYLVVDGATELIEFMKKGLGAEEMHRSTRGDGAILHAQVRIGSSILMLADAPQGRAPMPCSFYLYGQDVDGRYERALSAGGKSIMKPADMFYGDRNAGVVGPGGVEWWFATHIEDLSEAELARRAKAAGKG